MWKDDQELEKYLAGFKPREIGPLAIPQSGPGAWTRRLAAPASSFRLLATTPIRIPRLAFASILATIVLLSGGLLMVRARANSAGPVLWLAAKLPDGQVLDGALMTNGRPGSDAVGFGSDSYGARLTMSVRFLRREGDRVELGVKAKYKNQPPHSSEISETLKGIAEQNVWIEPGKNVEISVADFGVVEFAGDFIDHKPPRFFSPGDTVDPKAGDFRIVSPVLIRDDKEVVFDFTGVSSTTSNDSGTGLEVYCPGEGRFLFSPVPFKDAVQGSVSVSQIRFKADGRDYVLLTAVPVTRAATVWVRHDASYKPTEQNPRTNEGKGQLWLRSLSDFSKE
jgi:hypothetical protein